MARVSIDPNKTAYDNATVYFDRAKKMKGKSEEAVKQIEKTRKEIADLEKKEAAKSAAEEKRSIQTGAQAAAKKEWYHSYHWFMTSDGFLAIGGKSAGQNEEVVKKHLAAEDMFFHADIKGGSVVVLKNGKNAPDSSMEQAAQFAACNSNAWKVGYATIDVYSVPKDQVSKSPPPGEYLEKGSFFISGTKRYFRGMPLKLLVGRMTEENGGHIECVPEKYGMKGFSTCFALEPGRLDKNVVAEKLSRQLGVKKDDLLPKIPAGSTSFMKMK
jgi:predicted ribosome quality control (RQC) complex YloA/Tae2 family protein